MKKLNIRYKDYFRIHEQQNSNPVIPDAGSIKQATDELEKFGDALKKAGLTEEDLAEAQLVNSLSDYRGGVEYVVTDPKLARITAKKIKKWTADNGFNLIKLKLSASKRVGYFQFKLGEDVASEARKIQGYISQMPEVKYFRFNIK
jgi:hypothetical protein